MKKKEPAWVRGLMYFGYFIGSFFIGATFILIVEGLGDWYSDSLKDHPLWHWWLYSLITGAILIVAWRFILKTASEIDKDDDE